MIEDLKIERHGQELTVDGSLDSESELEIEICRDYADDARFYINKIQAIQIIAHLQKVFKITNAPI